MESTGGTDRPDLDKLGVVGVKERIHELGGKNPWCRKAQIWVEAQDAKARAADRATDLAIAMAGNEASAASARAAQEANGIAEKALAESAKSNVIAEDGRTLSYWALGISVIAAIAAIVPLVR